MDSEKKRQQAIRYIRAKVDQLLTLMGTLPLRPEELDDETLLELDPIGIVSDSFSQVLAHLHATNHKLNLARSEIRSIFDALPAAVVVANTDMMLEDCNQQARDWFFSSAEVSQLAGRRLNELCSCDIDMQQLRHPSSVQGRVIERHGQHFQVIASDISDESGWVEKTVFLFFDVTRQRAAEDNLLLYAKVFKHMGEGIMITGPDHRILQVNEAFTRITGYSEAELLGQNPSMLQSGLHDRAFFDALWRSIEEQGSWKGELFDRRKDGQIFASLQSISEVRNSAGELTDYISVVTDISYLKQTQSRLEFLSQHDVLTNLPNRSLFQDRLHHAIDRAKRDGTLFGLLFIDLDRFKNINDSLGHHIGDLLLIVVTQRLQTLVRQSDTIARIGGDEFVVLMETVAADADVTRMADKIVTALKEPFAVNGLDLHIGCSIGITFYPEDGDDTVTLLKNADAAMYRAKETGRDGHIRFSRELSDRANEKLGMENALRSAVRDSQFVLHYQPIIDLARGRVIATEALIRWPQADGSLISPDRFIPLTEETRLIIPLGAWVVREALAQYKRWRAQGLELDYVSVNVSAPQMTQPDFADRLVALLTEHDVAGQHLQVELTENVLFHDVELCKRVLNHLRQHGIRIAIDDFGTGYSSLSYLKQLPIDNLKIDRSFVRDIPGDANDCAIAEAIIGLSRTLGLHAIAEGIETEEQERYLRQIGCSCMQGYRYARPIPAQDFFDFASRFTVPV